MNSDSDLKTEGALHESQVTKLLHNILSVNSEAGVTFKTVFYRHKQSVLKVLHKSVLGFFLTLKKVENILLSHSLFKNVCV